MSVIAGLMVLGFALIMIEIFIPGGIVGALGGICLVAGVVVAYQDFGVEGAIITFLVGVVGLAACLFVEFKILPKTPVGKRLFLQNTITGKSQPDVADEDLVGKEGDTLTALSPSGYVRVDGRKFEAASKSGFLEKGDKVRVISYDQFKVTVSKI